MTLLIALALSQAAPQASQEKLFLKSQSAFLRKVAYCDPSLPKAMGKELKYAVASSDRVKLKGKKFGGEKGDYCKVGLTLTVTPRGEKKSTARWDYDCSFSEDTREAAADALPRIKKAIRRGASNEEKDQLEQLLTHLWGECEVQTTGSPAPSRSHMKFP